MTESFTEKATSSSNLKERSNINQKYGSNNFDAWVDDIFNELNFTNVLDICCGTGNQIVKMLNKPHIKSIIGIDLSQESLEIAKNRAAELGKSDIVEVKKLAMEELFQDSEVSKLKFDLITCFYGLYYASNVEMLLTQMLDHLTDNGSIVIVGPYGKNNVAFFDIIEKYYKLPDLVIRSSTTFMEEEVIKILDPKTKLTAKTFLNTIRYPDAKSIMDYWRASTFYDPDYDETINNEINNHFKINPDFILEKHVMACIASKI